MRGFWTVAFREAERRQFSISNEFCESDVDLYRFDIFGYPAVWQDFFSVCYAFFSVGNIFDGEVKTEFGYA